MRRYDWETLGGLRGADTWRFSRAAFRRRVALCWMPLTILTADLAWLQVPPFVGILIERIFPLSRRILFDHRCGATPGEEIPECLAVVGGVREHGFRWWKLFDQRGRWLDVMAIASGQLEGEKPGLGADDRMDFGCAPASTFADGLRFSPPFKATDDRAAMRPIDLEDAEKKLTFRLIPLHIPVGIRGSGRFHT